MNVIGEFLFGKPATPTAHPEDGLLNAVRPSPTLMAMMLEHDAPRPAGVFSRLSNDTTRPTLADAFEVRLQKALRQVISAQSSREGPPQGWRGVLAGVALGMFTMAGIVSVACQGSFAWVEDAKVGRMFSDIYPKLSPAAQAEVMKRAADYLRG